MRQRMLQGFDDATHIVFQDMTVLEKKLSNLPTRDLEYIVMQLKINRVLLAQRVHTSDTADKLATINIYLRQYQKETRRILADLQNKILRIATLLRTHSRSTVLSMTNASKKRQNTPFVKK